MYGDNPAGRLLSIVESGRNVHQGMVASDAWRQILEIGLDDSALLMERIGRVMSLPGQVVSQLEANHPRQFERNTHGHMVNCFAAAFSRNILGGRWNEFMAAIDIHAMQFLSSVDELFEAKKPGPALTADQLNELRSGTEELIGFVLNSEFPAELKKVLIDRMKIVLDAIDAYIITGAAPILDAVFCSIAQAHLSEQGRASMATQEGKFFMDKVAALANMMTVATGAIGIAQASVPVLAYFAK